VCWKCLQEMSAPHYVGSERAVRLRFCMDSVMLQKGFFDGVLTSEMEFAVSLGNGAKISKINLQTTVSSET
jgi:hypothetical protein